jgi:thymidine kinase
MNYKIFNSVYLKIISGPVFSGKTATLNTFLNDSQGKKIKIIHSYSKNQPFNYKNENLDSNVDIIYSNVLYNIKIDNYQIIGIDDCQFFQDLTLTIKIWLKKQDKFFIVSGLDYDYRKKEFGQTLSLRDLSDNFLYLQSKCSYCDKRSVHSKKIDETYKPVCDFHY